MSDIPLIPGRGLSTRTATELRLDFLKSKEIKIDAIADYNLEINSIQNNIESFIGSVEIPLGIVGPIIFNNNNKKEYVYAPVGTLEGALVASMNRGAKAIASSNGFTAKIHWQRMVRTPILLLENSKHAQPIIDWLKANFSEIKKNAQAYSNHASLIQIKAELVDFSLNLKFVYETGDAAGQNMTTTCTWHALLYIVDRLKNEFSEYPFDYIIEGNAASDKKVALKNIEEGRGIHVSAQCDISRQVIKDILRTTPEQILKFYMPTKKNAESVGMVSYNVNVANAVAAIFVATGQDLACIHESSSGLLHLEYIGNKVKPDGIRLHLTLPNLVIGTVGGGTHLKKQAEALEIMGCLGTGKVNRFAQLIAGFTMGLELSTYSAVVSGEFAKSHEKLGRNKPISWLLKSEITPTFLHSHFSELPANWVIQNLVWKDTNYLENGIITNITSRITKKLIGFLPMKLELKDGAFENLLIKSKAKDIEVLKGLHMIFASIDPKLSDLIKLQKNELEFFQCHEKELVVYEYLNKKGFKAMPTFYGKYINVEREIYLLGQELVCNDQILLNNSENNPEKWTDEWISSSLNCIFLAHNMLESLPLEYPSLLNIFKPWNSIILYEKLMDILIDNCDEEVQTLVLKNIKVSLLNIEEDCKKIEWPRSPIHNDFNPRNILIRSNEMPCIIDWELSMLDFPQRDLIEFLSFVLSEKFLAETLLNHLHNHFNSIVLRKGPGHNLGFKEYLKASEMAVRTYICCRVSFYEISGIIAKYDFSKRILAVSIRMQKVILDELKSHKL